MNAHLAAGPREKRRIPLERAERMAEYLVEELEPVTEFLMIAGSVRRGDTEIGDVEAVVLPMNWENTEGLEGFYNYLWVQGFSGGTRKQSKMEGGVKLEVYIALHPDEIGGHIFMYTGDWQFNIAMRNKAKRMGFKLDQYGIWDGDEIIVDGPDESVFFEFLDVEWHEPSDRSLSRRTPEERRERARKARKAVMASAWGGDE